MPLNFTSPVITTSFVRTLSVTLLLTMLVLPLTATPAHAESVVSRAAGPERIETAITAYQNFRDNAEHAVLATAYSFPDALAAGALTNTLSAPLLLTNVDALPQGVADELQRLGVKTVWILGGLNAVSADVEAGLQALGYETRRLAGASRYETAREIAVTAGPSTTGEVVLALGEHADPDRAWPDAVASGALAATPDRIPTLLTQPDALPTATEEALATLQTTQITILGGTNIISEGVQTRLTALGYQTTRVIEDSRYTTSVALAEEALARFDDSARPAVFASGRAFPDALAAGSLAASLGAPLLLVPPVDDLPPASESFLRDNSQRFASGVVVGGPNAASDYVVSQLDAALQNEPAPVKKTAPTVAEPPEEDPVETEPVVLDTFSGTSSWYGPGLAGNLTANGEIFDPSQLTAAHLTLPFNTIIRVTNLNNGLVVQVRINDRGPYVGRRVLDVSSAAADVLGMKSTGTAPVTVEVLSYG
ncbi:hypothetical protein BH24ACT15_BH24ACT15_32130 [soil metagenome]